MERVFRYGTITIKQGDITRESVDAIVNAANSSLMGGGGVDGAIHRAGGPMILAECKAIVSNIGKLPPGQAVITTAGMLPSRRVIHTVGPIWRGGENNESGTLRSCYRTSLQLAEEHHLKTIAFPSISTGAYRYPVGSAAKEVLGVVKDFLDDEHGSIGMVTFVLFDQRTFDSYHHVLREL